MSFKLRRLFLTTIYSLICFTAETYAQHADIQFEYTDGKIDILSLPTGVAESEFPTSGFFKQLADDPGFLSEVDTGQGIGADDGIVYNVLSDLVYWDGSAFNAPTMETQIRIENNAGSDTLITTSSGLQEGDFSSAVNLIDQASASGDLHSHVDFELEIDGSSAMPALGSYGIKLSLSTDAVGIDDSDPFYIVFDFGLSELEYEAGIAAFSALLMPTVLAGDFNNDGSVDAADYTVWRDHLGNADETAINEAGDGLNGVDSADYTVWVNNFGATSMSNSSATSVPEPASSFMLALLASSRFACRYRND